MPAKLERPPLLRARLRRRLATPDGLSRFLCEWGAYGCRERVEVPASFYDEARRMARFFLAQGHVLGG